MRTRSAARTAEPSVAELQQTAAAAAAQPPDHEKGERVQRAAPSNAFLAEAIATGEAGARRQERARQALAAEDEKVGPGVFPSGDEGEEVEVEGDYTISPRQFNTMRFRVSAKTAVRPGENRCDAARRLAAQLAVAEREEFARRLAQFEAFYDAATGAKR